MRCAPSTRRFTEQPVPRELLERALDNARFAPSGGNRQGWRVIVVTDEGRRRRLRELYEEPWRHYTEHNGMRALLDNPPPNMPPGRLRILRSVDEFAHTFDRVPVHLVICAQLDALAIVDSSLERPSIVGGASVYPFVQNLLLALRAEGLGAAFTTLLTPSEAQVRELLGFPQDVALAGHISVGYRADPWPKRLSRNPVSEFAYGDAWGQAW
ncbi:MAG: nitroreductase family protein [Actinomycetota bacterium]|nr:nitroreductase family protein [Actinomycetota bacterium]